MGIAVVSFGALLPTLVLASRLLEALTFAPNITTGPAGFGTEKWVRGAAAMPYRVDFENLPGVASAPAQVVRITVPIDANLDPASFRLGSMGFGGTHQINVPAGRTSYSAQTYYSDLNLSVRVTAGINLTTCEASSVFTTIDPATGQQPVNPLVGFLQVNDTFGSGTGFATYSIQPYAAAVSGSTVQAQAFLEFETGVPPVWSQGTYAASFSNRVDPNAPSSLMESSWEILDASTIRVRWTTQDAVVSSGMASSRLFMNSDGGPFTLVGENLLANQANVAVALGHTYGFFARASDNVGNVEPDKTAAELVVPIYAPPGGEEDPPGPPRDVDWARLLSGTPGRLWLELGLPEPTRITVEIYDLCGRRLGTPVDEAEIGAGRHRIPISGPGRPGLYFVRIRSLKSSLLLRAVTLR